ncbi:MAG: bifunctional 5,10-methylenetetrahydrofolate dehydrogenase/5,10-methenyltetrahydrofolate cyclohydrolase [bacterium]
MEIIDGKKIGEETLYYVSEVIKKNKYEVTLAIIVVGDDYASDIYVNKKKVSCELVGIKCVIHKLKDVTEKEVINLIKELNDNEDIDGIILQSPLPKGIDFNKCISYLDPKKDIDGVTKESVYNNYMNLPGLLPCTVKGIIKIFDYYDIDLTGKNVCIVGRSNLVGKPLFHALENRGATVSLCHSKTDFIGTYTERADIIVMACGIPELLKGYMVNEGVIVIDVGINRTNNGMCGDVDFESVSQKASFITPVPGGVGPMTVASIMENTLTCHIERRK